MMTRTKIQTSPSPLMRNSVCTSFVAQTLMVRYCLKNSVAVESDLCDYSLCKSRRRLFTCTVDICEYVYAFGICRMYSALYMCVVLCVCV